MWAGLGWARLGALSDAGVLMLCPPLQWMVPTIQNSMKPFKVSSQALLWLGAGGEGRVGVQPREPAESCLCRIWTTHASLSAS